MRFQLGDILGPLIVRAEEGCLEGLFRPLDQVGEGAVGNTLGPPCDSEERRQVLGRQQVLAVERREATLIGLEVDESDEANMLCDAGNDLFFEKEAVRIAHGGEHDDPGDTRTGVDVTGVLATPAAPCGGGPVEEVGIDDQVGSELEGEAGPKAEVSGGAGGATEALPVPQDAMVPGHGSLSSAIGTHGHAARATRPSTTGYGDSVPPAAPDGDPDKRVNQCSGPV